MIDKNVLKKNFSRNAVNYDTYAVIQKKMAHQLLKTISFEHKDTHDSINILDIGCGTGYFTEQLARCYPNANITAVDIAPGMIEYARKKLRSKKIEFLCADIEEVEINRKYDLIVSNATFQWFNQLEQTIIKLDAMLKNSGMLAFSTFGPMTFNELHRSYKMAADKLNLVIDSLPGQKFFSCEDLLNICQRSLADTSFSYKVAGLEKYEYEYFDTVRDFLKSVKKIGANNSNCDRKTIPALIKEMIKIYETTFTEGNRIKVTYHCIFLTVEKRKTDPV
ncbi:biotin biosynthesis protein BioC [Desulfotomaculum nigrificans CO-1-SRB]|uniref:Malonyl-[acyl-carrier protein] O-methyltransferase n=1 Tax=Desulfotomaculum nigrificans (strain DSM 14880 / VKM B-2319 / CO-1-SRB) TaxID=868595 RepID=F6B3Z7_DESCC|nr:malonyl-ACP O-methyltransferase BioC [Desulfotomaculum nigrificans]AEF92962.1 biotin biosynthesis protein BioC [Desulfotomaculum nigrificans CO-1-SRB]